MSNNKLDFELVLAELARGNVVAEGNFEDVLHFLSKRTAESLAVRRVSVWLFDNERSKLTCAAVYDVVDQAFHQGEELSAVDYPSYFSALERMRTIAAVEAAVDPRTDELRETYLRRHNIVTMLDAPVFLQGAVVGVICHEHSDSPREWSAAEKSFAGSIADFISLALAAKHRLETERQLRETEVLLESVTAQMSDGFCLVEPISGSENFLMRYVNASGAAMSGYTPDELVGQSSSLVRAPNQNIDLPQLIENRQDKGPVIFEMMTQRKDGSTFPLEISANLIEHNRKNMFVLVGRDISARQSAEESRIAAQAKNLQTERLESLGMLAGKIAHDFNNLLVGVLGNVSLAMRSLPPAHKASGYLVNIESTAQIAADLCNQLLIYSGNQQFDLKSVNLSELVAEMSSLLAVSLPPNVNLQNQTQNDLPAISAEPTQVRQVILNLITNAADAVNKNGGTITVKTCVQNFAETDLQQTRFNVHAANFFDNAQNKTCVCLAIKDDGEGMSAETQRRMFEPFFSNKAKGSGLGLASLAGIVRAHGGAVSVESALAQGSTVTIWFPVQSEESLQA